MFFFFFSSSIPTKVVSPPLFETLEPVLQEPIFGLKFTILGRVDVKMKQIQVN